MSSGQLYLLRWLFDVCNSINGRRTDGMEVITNADGRCSPGTARRHLHPRLHCNGPLRQLDWFCWSRIRSQGASCLWSSFGNYVRLNHIWLSKLLLTPPSCGSIVEIVLFMILLKQKQFLVIKAAILGSILATMLLCLGLCFLVGGMRREEQTFSDAISEAGSGILLTA